MTWLWISLILAEQHMTSNIILRQSSYLIFDLGIGAPAVCQAVHWTPAHTVHNLISQAV